MRPGRPPAALAAAVVLGLGLRLGLIALAGDRPERLVTLDGEGYLALARDFPRAYVDEASPVYGIALQYPPGYPAFAAAVLSLTGDSTRGLALAQCLVAAATLWLVYVLARRLLGDGPAMLAALLLALDPASAIYSVVSQPEALFTGLVVASALALTRALEGRPRAALVAGTLLGLAMLVRPIGVLLPLAAAAVVVWRRGLSLPVARLAGLVLLPGLLLGGAWVARNRAVTGVSFFAAIEGANGLYYRAAGALAMSEGIPVAVARSRLAEEELRRGSQHLDAGGRIRLQTGMMLEVLSNHPLGTLQAALQGWVRLSAGTGLSALSALRGDPDPEGNAGGKPLLNALLAAPLAVVLLGAILAIPGIPASRSVGERQTLALSFAYVAYFLLMSSFLEANTRFRVPMTPFLCLLAGLGWSRFFSGARGPTTGACEAPPPEDA